MWTKHDYRRILWLLSFTRGIKYKCGLSLQPGVETGDHNNSLLSERCQSCWLRFIWREHVKLLQNFRSKMFAMTMLIAVSLVLLYSAEATTAKEGSLCRSFDGAFRKSVEPQTLTFYADFYPSEVTIGDENIYVKEDHCVSENGNYSCRLVKVHESGFWRFEIDGMVTANVDSILLSASSKKTPPVAIHAKQFCGERANDIDLQLSSPLVLCPGSAKKGATVIFYYHSGNLTADVKMTFYMDGIIQCSIGNHEGTLCDTVVHKDWERVVTVPFDVTRFQVPSKRYRIVTAVTEHATGKKIVTKIVDLESTVWDPLCDTYDGTFSFAELTSNITAYPPFRPQKIVMGGSESGKTDKTFKFTNNKCQGNDQVLDCKLTEVDGTNVFKFELYKVERMDFNTIQFLSSDAEHPQSYNLYRQRLTNVEQFMFSPMHSQPFVHCPSPSSYYADISCGTARRSKSKNVRVLQGDAVLCDEKTAGYPICLSETINDKTIVRQRVFKTKKTNRFVYINCEYTNGDQKSYMTHLIDFGRNDAHDFGEDGVEETWSKINDIYNGTFQLNSKPDYFYAFMDFVPKYYGIGIKMDGEYCFSLIHNFTCKILKVVGSSFWRVEIWPDEPLTEVSFKDRRNSPINRYVMYSNPLPEKKEGFLLSLSQPFVHQAGLCPTVSIKCVFKHQIKNKHIHFRVYTKYRVICFVDQQQSPACDNAVFDEDAGIVTVTVNVYRRDINGERYGIFTCEYDKHLDLYHLVDFGPRKQAV